MACSKRQRVDDSDTEESSPPLSFDEKYETDKKTPEEVLALKKKGWTSKVYAHFQDPVIEIDKDGNVKYRFTCKINPSQSCVRSGKDRGTKNLLRHVESCSGKRAPDDQTITKFAQGSTYSSGTFRFLIARWIIECHRPFKIIEDPPLHEMFKMLYSRVTIPSDTTVSRDVREVYKISQEQVAKVLQAYLGRIHIGFDGWTSPNVKSYLGIVVSYADKGRLRSFILDFVTLTASHTGKYLAEELEKCLRKYGIADKILGQACDNATNNDTLLAELEIRIPSGAHGTHTRIRCICHILNLVVKAILSQFTKKKGKASKNTKDDDDDDDEALDQEELWAAAAVDPDREAHDEEEIEKISEWILLAEELTEKEIAVGKKALDKITKLAKRIFHSSLLREDLANCCARAKIDSKLIQRSVPTRWNSVAEMLNSALDIRLGLERLVDMAEHNQVAKTALRKFKLTADEWTLLTQLRPILQHFLSTTLRLSQKRVPLLHEVIPIIQILREKLEDAADDTFLYRSVRAAAMKGMAVLDKYYAKTDESIMYRVAMILNPKYKTAYFKLKKFDEAWIDEAVKVTQDHWNAFYKPSDSSIQTSAGIPASSKKDDLFSELDNFGSATIGDELDEYLKTPPIAGVTDPLAWWSTLNDTPLSRMGRDFMSAPASSCDVERGFSRGGLNVSKLRHALSDESTRASTVAHSWSEFPELIPAAKIVEIFQEKQSRLGKQKKQPVEQATDVEAISVDLSEDEMVVDSM